MENVRKTTVALNCNRSDLVDRQQVMSQGLGVLPYIGYIGMCRPYGYGVSAVLIINRVSILAISVINRVWFWHSRLYMGMFLTEKKLLFRHCQHQQR